MSFYDHFLSTKPTTLGRGFSEKAALLMRAEILRHVPNVETLLEIGPGRGDFCLPWKNGGGDVTVLEPNPTLGAALKKQGIRVIESLAPPILCDDDQFDVVLASHVIEHMSSVEMATELVEEMMRVCKPGGCVCIAAPDIRAFKADFWNVDYTHNYVTSPRRIEQLFLDVGLHTEKPLFYSGYLTGITATLLSFLARLIPSGGMVGSMTQTGLWQKVYKLKVTFLGNFFLIGRKPL